MNKDGEHASSGFCAFNFFSFEMSVTKACYCHTTTKLDVRIYDNSKNTWSAQGHHIYDNMFVEG